MEQIWRDWKITVKMCEIAKRCSQMTQKTFVLKLKHFAISACQKLCTEDAQYQY